MKYYNGLISEYENTELLDKMKNLTSVEKISIKLPKNLDEELKESIIEFLCEPLSRLKNMANDKDLPMQKIDDMDIFLKELEEQPDDIEKWKIESVLEDVRISLIQSLELDGYGNNYSIVNGVLEIKGWEHIKRVLQLCKRQIYYYNSELKENWEKLISHIMHELLLVGMPFEAIVHVPKLKREPNSNIINESYFVGPTIQFNKRSEDYFTPIINYTIELSNGKICGFDPVGVHYLEYLVYGNNIYIDDAVVYKLGIKSGDIINIRLFIFPRNLYPIFIYSPDGNVEEIAPRGQYHG